MTHAPDPHPDASAPEPRPDAAAPAAPDDAAPAEATRRADRRGAILSLVSFLVVLALAELGYRRSAVGRRLAVESVYVVKADAYSRSPGYDVAVVGDSRVLHGVDPRVVERVLLEDTGRAVSVWNAGLPGAQPMAHLAWVERFLSHRHRPHTVVLAVTPNAFGTLLADPPSREALSTMYRLRDLPAARAAGTSLEELCLLATMDVLDAMRFRTRTLDVELHGEGLRGAASPGIQGYGPIAAVDAATQDARARHRLIGHAWEMHRNVARFGNEQVGYFREALRRLRDAHVRTLVLNSPSASQLDAAYGPESFYAEHIAWVQAQARAYGATYVDARHSPAMSDADYTDGDHMSVEGAAHFSAWLARAVLAPALGR